MASLAFVGKLFFLKTWNVASVMVESWSFEEKILVRRINDGRMLASWLDLRA